MSSVLPNSNQMRFHFHDYSRRLKPKNYAHRAEDLHAQTLGLSAGGGIVKHRYETGMDQRPCDNRPLSNPHLSTPELAGFLHCRSYENLSGASQPAEGGITGRASCNFVGNRSRDDQWLSERGYFCNQSDLGEQNKGRSIDDPCLSHVLFPLAAHPPCTER